MNAITNIGYVVYKRGEEPGTPEAEWCHSYTGKGKGIATGGMSGGFEGRYNITYFDNKNNLMSNRELVIQKTGDVYKLAWIKEGIIKAEGIEMVVSDRLTAGRCDVED